MSCTRHRVFLAALIVAAKYLNDSSPKNKHWTRYAALFSQAETSKLISVSCPIHLLTSGLLQISWNANCSISSTTISALKSQSCSNTSHHSSTSAKLPMLHPCLQRVYANDGRHHSSLSLHHRRQIHLRHPCHSRHQAKQRLLILRSQLSCSSTSSSHMPLEVCLRQNPPHRHRDGRESASTSLAAPTVRGVSTQVWSLITSRSRDRDIPSFQQLHFAHRTASNQWHISQPTSARHPHATVHGLLLTTSRGASPALFSLALQVSLSPGTLVIRQGRQQVG